MKTTTAKRIAKHVRVPQTEAAAIKKAFKLYDEFVRMEATDTMSVLDMIREVRDCMAWNGRRCAVWGYNEMRELVTYFRDNYDTLAADKTAIQRRDRRESRLGDRAAYSINLGSCGSGALLVTLPAGVTLPAAKQVAQILSTDLNKTVCVMRNGVGYHTVAQR